MQGPSPADAAKPAPLRVEDLTPANARPMQPAAAKAINAHQPLSAAASPAAQPFQPAFASGTARMRSVDCLTQAIYYEAANESAAGQKAVAQVVLNRVRNRAYPNTVCGVVYQGAERRTGCQFTFTCDGSLRRTPSSGGWARARKVAEAALAGEVFAPVGYSTHYHADYVVPYWSASLLKTAVLGRHIFYRVPGALGRPSSFSARYAGVEPDVMTRAPEAPAERAKPTWEEDDFASATYIDFDDLAKRPPEEKAEEFDKFGLLDYRAEAGPDRMVKAGDPATEAVVAAALASRSSRPAPPAPIAPAS